ncbi:MAG: CHAT domain-containing protein [bacterium]
MNYFDFDLILARAGKRYKAFVDSPAGQAAVDFSLPFSELELENFLLKIGRPRQGRRRVDSPEMKTVKAFGMRLFEAVFAGEVRGCFRSSLDEAGRQKVGLRVRLRMTNTPELADLPWEYLYNPSLNRFLAVSKETPLVRYLDLPERILPLLVKPPLKVLAVISSPADYMELAIAREWEKLNEALVALERRGLVTLERLEKTTLSALRKCLRESEHHIFHFIGHGGFDQQSQDGVLILEDHKNQGVAVSGQNLGTLLRDARTLRLVLLNACEGARSARKDPFAGVAQSLVQQGIPAVIAMQFEVTDKFAIAFAREFYTAVADGNPIDTALSETRKAILVEGNDIEWAAPVLYMRSSDGRIFDIAPEDEETKDIAPADEPLAQLYNAHIRLSLLFYLDNLPNEPQGLSITEICQTLNIKKRKDAVAALQDLSENQLVEKARKSKSVYWRIAAKGREVLQKLEDLIKTRVETPAR